jgi:hypothetical protein
MLDAVLETKTKGDLSLEAKNADITWDDADFTWDESNPDTWDSNRLHADLEAKTKGDLTLETKI